MWSDPIVDQIRAEAKAWSDQFGGDVNAMFAELRRLDEASGELLVTLPPRAPASGTPVLGTLSTSSAVDATKQSH
jgi:hypothetical protein